MLSFCTPWMCEAFVKLGGKIFDINIAAQFLKENMCIKVCLQVSASTTVDVRCIVGKAGGWNKRQKLSVYCMILSVFFLPVCPTVL